MRAYLLVYVHDILLMGNNSDMVDSVLSKLATVFKIRDLGRLRFFLGIEAIHTNNNMILSQHRYMTELLRKAGMESCNPLSTPMATTVVMTDGGSAVLDDLTPYRQLIGSLMYLLITRPNLSYAVNQMCHFMHNPTQNHWAALKRVLRYMKGTLHLGIRFTPASTPVIHAISDSN
ncbi:PREDICTED: uncharacterized protein LOC109154406 [Ipomoea nil]|uniref:uncharacterized protein LOC109154406 n=1 Tax=Ipomoea nil TaxID=35883 RepID=UPI00090187E0|nr:PREDICTED: uncharacterized protein LOC109154406 [Ipomoea nil]